MVAKVTHWRHQHIPNWHIFAKLQNQPEAEDWRVNSVIVAESSHDTQYRTLIHFSMCHSVNSQWTKPEKCGGGGYFSGYTAVCGHQYLFGQTNNTNNYWKCIDARPTCDFLNFCWPISCHQHQQPVDWTENCKLLFSLYYPRRAHHRVSWYHFSLSPRIPAVDLLPGQRARSSQE